MQQSSSTMGELGLAGLLGLVVMAAHGVACSPGGTTLAGGAGGVDGAGAGSPAGGAGGTGAGDAGPTGSCRDYRLRRQDLDLEGEWLGAGVMNNGVSLHRGRLDFAWVGGYVSEASGNGVHDTLFFTSLDVRTGELVKYDGPDPIPAHVAGSNGGALVGGTSPDGTFLVIYWYETSPGVPEVFYALGELGDPRTMDLGKLLPQDYLPTRITWDGEAFQVHGESGGTVSMTRVSPSGEVLVPKTDVAKSWNRGYGPFGYRLAYEPVSELTWIWDGDGLSSGLLQAHDKLGVPLFPAPGIDIEGLEDLPTGIAMSVRPEGVSVVWQEFDLFPDDSGKLDGATRPYADRVGVDGQREGVFGFSHGLAYDWFTLLDRAPRKAALVAIDHFGAHLLELDYEAKAVSPPALFYDAATPSATGINDLRERILFELDGTLWLVINEASQGDEAPTRRVLELNPGCVYKSWLHLVDDGEAGLE
jgi:hypothetical protein